MKKWFRFFFLGFFSDKISKEAARRSYTNVFIGLILAFIFLWSGFMGSYMLPFSAQYNSSSDFRATVHSVFAHFDTDKRIVAEISDGSLKVKGGDGKYVEDLLIDTFGSEEDRQSYSVNGYNVVVDTRPATTLAEVEAYALSNDGKNTKISYEDYLTLSDVARLNFDFKLRYTGNALLLDDKTVAEYRSYLDGLSDEVKSEAEKLQNELNESKITNSEYNRAIYELYFTSYYPEITDYESASKVPLLRNYYYHQYLKNAECKYLFVFDDCLTGSFETKTGLEVTFYGFYNDLPDGLLISEESDADKAVDSFIKKSFLSMTPINAYAYVMNVFTLIPFVALMPMVVALLCYSILKLSSIESLTSLGGTFKIVGSYVWISAAISTVTTLLCSFFFEQRILTMLMLLLLFICLAVRSIIFAVNEARAYKKQSEEQQTVQTEA